MVSYRGCFRGGRILENFFRQAVEDFHAGSMHNESGIGIFM